MGAAIGLSIRVANRVHPVRDPKSTPGSSRGEPGVQDELLRELDLAAHH